MPGSTAAVLGAAVLAGLIAGAVTSGFPLVVAEPVIERAIELEKQATVGHGAKSDVPVVSRAGQRLARARA